jgi:hypothetical protein
MSPPISAPQTLIAAPSAIAATTRRLASQRRRPGEGVPTGAPSVRAASVDGAVAIVSIGFSAQIIDGSTHLDRLVQRCYTARRSSL